MSTVDHPPDPTQLLDLRLLHRDTVAPGVKEELIRRGTVLSVYAVEVAHVHDRDWWDFHVLIEGDAYSMLLSRNANRNLTVEHLRWRISSTGKPVEVRLQRQAPDEHVPNGFIYFTYANTGNRV